MYKVSLMTDMAGLTRHLNGWIGNVVRLALTGSAIRWKNNLQQDGGYMDSVIVCTNRK